jgi:hypothetical protein
MQQVNETNCETGETIIRDMTESEISQFNLIKIKAAQNSEALAKVEADKLATRAAVLTRLGLSSDELLALLS